MFSKLFKKKNSSEIRTNVTVAAIAMFLLNDEGSDLETPYKKYINVEKLDYSLESLKEVDAYLNKVRKKRKTLSEEQLIKVIFRCGAYSGEVIRRNPESELYWDTYDNLHANLDEFGGKSPLTFYILTDGNGRMVFPMTKVHKFLDYGMQDSLFFYAQTIWQAKDLIKKNVSLLNSVKTSGK